MQPHNPNTNPSYTGVVWFLWYAADSAHALDQLVAIDYSDSPPDVAFTYDRLGRPLTITDVLGTRTNVYDALNLLEERHPDGTALLRAYDPYGRPFGLALGTNYAVTYAYDDLLEIPSGWNNEGGTVVFCRQGEMDTNGLV